MAPPPSTRLSRPLAHSSPLKSATASSRPARRMRTSDRNTRPAAMAMIFVGESWLVRGLGIALAAGLVFLSLVRSRRAGLDEAVADFSGDE